MKRRWSVKWCGDRGRSVGRDRSDERRAIAEALGASVGLVCLHVIGGYPRVGYSDCRI